MIKNNYYDEDPTQFDVSEQVKCLASWEVEGNIYEDPGMLTYLCKRHVLTH